MRVLKFYADWCGPCKMLTKVLEDYKGDVQIQEINIDEHQEVAIRYGIRGVPTMVLLNDNDGEVARKVGMVNLADFEKFVSQQ